MPLILSGNVASALPTGYNVANSCRFNDGDTPYMSKTPGSAGNRDRWTFSCWVKRGNLSGVYQTIISASGASADDTDYLYFNSDNTLHVHLVASASAYGTLYTNRIFKDISAWYNIILVYDSADGTAGDRLIMYINGVRETSFSASSFPDQNADSVMTLGSGGIDVGRDGSSSGSGYLDGYLSETVLIDGLALAPTSFGEFNEDSPTIWQPIDVSGLTFGTNGFYLDFEASDNLGNDANGGTDLTETNLAATDQATDTPTNNFAVMNPLDNYYGNYTFSEGNCQVVSSSGDKAYVASTLAVSKGKWYFETKMSTMVTDERFLIGIAPGGAVDDDHPDSTANGGINLSGFNAVINSQGSSILNNFYGANTTRFDSWTGIIGMALDLTDGSEQITFSKDGAWVTGDGATDTDFSNALQVDISGKMDESTATGFWHLVVGEGNSSAAGTFQINFGGCPAFTVSSSNADADGYGNFEYPVPSGYYALNTKNLAEYG